MAEAFDRTARRRRSPRSINARRSDPGGLDATLPSSVLDATLADATTAQAALKPLAHGLVLGTTIGEGGMAVVLGVVVCVWKMQRRGRRIAGYLELLRPDG